MGCFQSKVPQRTLSFRGDECLHSRSIRFSILEDMANGSKAGGDSFLALLWTSNTISTKLKAAQEEEEENSSILLNHADSKIHHTVNAWELLAGLEDQEDEYNGPTILTSPEKQGLEQEESVVGPTNDDDSLLQIDETHVDDHLLCSTSGHGRMEEESDMNSAFGEAPFCEDSVDVYIRDPPDGDSMLLSICCRAESEFLSEVEAIKISRIQSFRFHSIGECGDRTGNEEEECSTPKFGSYIDSSNFHSELIAQLEEAMRHLEEEDVLMKIAEDFLNYVHQEN